MRDAAQSISRVSAVMSAFEHAPAGMLVCEGPDHLVVAGNAAGLAMVGDGVVGHPYRVGMPDLTGQGLYEMFDRTYRTGETLTADRWRVVREPGAPTTENFYTFSTAAWRRDGGDIGGVLITAVDVTEEVVAQAEQVDRYTAARDVVLELQRNLLPGGLPILPRLRLAAQYHVAGTEMQAGGDWFDAIVVNERRIALMVGDVVGHGPAAAAAMARLSPVLHELLADGTELSTAVNRLDRFAAQSPATRAATLCVALIDPISGRVEFARRGHAAPLICDPGGTVRRLTGGDTGPLGVDVEMTRTAVAELPAGAVLLLYSDGLWERPGSTVVVDLDRLASSARAAMSASSQRIPSAVDRVSQFTVEFQARSGVSDDVTVLAAMRPPPGPTSDLFLEQPSIVERIAAFHDPLRSWLLAFGVGLPVAEDLCLAAYEAVANCALHAYRDRPAGVTRLTGQLTSQGRVELAISDTGRWSSSRVGSSGGRGMAIMRAVTDQLDVDMSSGGTKVILSRRVLHPTVVGTGPISTAVPMLPEVPFRVRVDPGPWPVLRVSGPVDVTTAPELRRAIGAQDTGGVRPVHVDLSSVTFLSSAGVQLLYELSRRQLRLSAAPDSPAAHVLELSMLEHVLHTTAT